VLRVLLITTAFVIALWALYQLASLVFVLILATLVAYVMAPLVERAEGSFEIAGRRRQLPRWGAVSLVYILIGGGLFAAAVVLLPSASQQVGDMVVRAPAYAQSVVTWEHGWTRYYDRLRMPLELRHAIDQSALAAADAAQTAVRRSSLAVVGAFSNLPWLLLIPILAFFLLKDASSLRVAVLTALPRQHQLRSHRLLEDLDTTVAAYIRAQLLACLAVGGLCGLGFAVLGVPYPILLSVLAGVLEFIPLVGPLLLAVVAAILAALRAPMLVFGVLAFLIILRFVEDYAIYPRLMRHGLRLHPLSVIVAVLAGAELGGVPGIFLAVPTVAVSSVVFRHWMEWRTALASAGMESA
jgi:predicted PurR-regulated permease PerM